VGLSNISTVTGRILIDSTGAVVRKTNGELFTTEDDFFINGSPVNTIRLESNVTVTTATENIGKYQIVKFVSVGNVALAGYDDAGDAALAITVEDILVNNPGTCILQGVITNSAWSWSSVGDELWVSENGILVDVDPHITDSLTYPVGRVPVGRVLSPTSIIFSQGMGGKGEQGVQGIQGTPGSAPELALNDLTDVAITSGLSGQLLTRVGSLWINSAAPVVPAVLDDLTDVDAPTPSLNDVLEFDGTGWVSAALEVDITDLTGVAIVTPTTNQVLTFNGVAWANAALPAPVLDLNALTDVTITTPAPNQVLTYSGGQWINITPASPSLSLNDLTDVTVTGTPDQYEVLRADGVGGWTHSLVPLKYVVVNSGGGVTINGGLDAISIGSGATANGSQSLVIGHNANGGVGTQSMAIGTTAAATANYSIAVGQGTSATHASSVVIGKAASTSTNEVTIADTNQTGDRVKIRFDSLHRTVPRGAILEKVVALGDSNPLSIPTEQGNIFTTTIAGDRTITAGNGIAGNSFTLEITNGGVARTLTFGSGFTTVKWPGGTQPPSTTGVDVYTFYTVDGNNWRAALAASYTS
jgi:hypothetical protein